MLLAPAIIERPLQTMGMLLGMAAAAVAVLLTTQAFRRNVVPRIPQRLADHQRRSIRVGTKIVRSYGYYLVGFYTVVAVIVVLGAVGTLF